MALAGMSIGAAPAAAAAPAPAAAVVVAPATAAADAAASDKDEKKPQTAAAAGAAAAEVVSDAPTAAAAGGAVATAADKERLHAAQVEREKELHAFEIESGLLERKAQVDRINTVALKLNPLDVMDLSLDAGAAEVQKKYRELSLLIHPDKCSPDIRENAQKAFALLSAARNELLDVTARAKLQEIVNAAKDVVKKRREHSAKQQQKLEQKKQAAQDKLLGLKGAAGAGAGAVRDVTKDPEYVAEVKQELKEMLISGEWRKRQLLAQAARSDGLAATEKEEVVKKREEQQKAEEDWEKNRDGRVSNWRTFQKFGRKRNLKMPRLNEIDDDKTYIKRVKTRGPEPQRQADPNKHDD